MVTLTVVPLQPLVLQYEIHCSTNMLTTSPGVLHGASCLDDTISMPRICAHGAVKQK